MFLVFCHMKTPKRALGDWGETQAVQFLEGQGYEIVGRNYQVKMGEIDIVAWHVKSRFGRTLCFVEVKTRSYGVGTAERATDYQKLQRLFQAARAYCIQEKINIEKTPIQFEQVSVYVDSSTIHPTFKHDVIIVE